MEADKGDIARHSEANGGRVDIIPGDIIALGPLGKRIPVKVITGYILYGKFNIPWNKPGVSNKGFILCP